MRTSGSVAFNAPALRAGRSALSPVLRVPVGCTRFDVSLNGESWPAESRIKIGVQAKYKGKFKEFGSILTSREGLVNGRVAVGLFFDEPIDEEIIARGSVRLLTGPSVDIEGVIICA